MNNKSELISKIKKDTETISNLWNEAKTNYKYVKNHERKLTYVGKQLNRMRESMNAIVKIALDDYEPHGKYFENFYDFLHWYLKDVSINTDEWSELEKYWHKRRSNG